MPRQVGAAARDDADIVSLWSAQPLEKREGRRLAHDAALPEVVETKERERERSETFYWRTLHLNHFLSDIFSHARYRRFF